MSAPASVHETPLLTRRAIAGDTPEVLTDIYQDDANIVIWQRKLADELSVAAAHLLDIKPTLQTY